MKRTVLQIDDDDDDEHGDDDDDDDDDDNDDDDNNHLHSGALFHLESNLILIFPMALLY